MVGGGEVPKYDPKKIIIWDDSKLKEITEFRFRSIIRDCYIRKDYLISIGDYEITIIDFKSKQIIEELSTINNIEGISAFSSNINSSILLYPMKEPGYLIMKDLKKKNSEKKIKVHQNPIAIIRLNYDSTMFATASDLGTLIRVFSINGNMLNEVRRGSENALIYDISFDVSNNYLGVVSNRSTVHIFSISSKDKNKKSFFKSMGGIFGIQNILNSEWSFAQLKLNLNTKAIMIIDSEHNQGCILDIEGTYTLTSFGMIINSFNFEKVDERDIISLI